ncbi:glutamate dehydrogenase [Rhodococcoides fascians]|uniref:NAD-glutamate dehydrogenase domain-containing protein n=1 Tax=Rhodococcoides fascians TaxID=1828 RepID=UPI000B9B1976|nr:NAD-glutamate dehydrogenase domain-containing protein [Rhodococcus fascians]OZE92410.1 glutamate dehydrogenase [Rhodococcus fascians]OZF23043.1 glutamate dehydrogenase [Rhodococcus fascians]OZF24757.1 glutamate dehydrogenase [Rhodococcus fascians]OZF73006.1 glutamate dehydrogenase [Rhodococcus fascians]OZF74171.1 glutamate dehydrogenase [Rhodococcus fascians]
MTETRNADSPEDWDTQLSDTSLGHLGGPDLAQSYSNAFSPNYKADNDIDQTWADIQAIEQLATGEVDITTIANTPERTIRLRLLASGTRITLTRIVPILHSMDLDVLDERAYSVTRNDGNTCWIYDLGLQPSAAPPESNDAATPPLHQLADLITHTVRAIWDGQCETDRFNALVTATAMPWQNAAILRAYAAYLHQLGLPYAQSSILDALLDNPAVTTDLAQLFITRFDPDISGDERESISTRLRSRLSDAIDGVAAIDTDRILRAFFSGIEATVRTNFYLHSGSDTPRALALKIEPAHLTEAPAPRPLYEVFVYSTRVEGVHLRFGKVARGGLRWSDRRDDYRTEILGLAKAQAVKNAIIVPAGAKGGFVVKRPSAQQQLRTPERDTRMAQGIACYREFISALLDLTDDLDVVTREVLPPQRVVRHDGDDTYLVVAADKGTAAFSDHANAVALERGFWLGDAFASGGSVGYDHKAMAITARGAWESVRSHFRGLGVDVDRDSFSAVGVGDMSGDVFGNGMLLSRTLHLVAAFDHRHIFIDPTPDPETSFTERARLFALPRSSWADYDPTVLSDGGFVVPRTAKRITVTAPVRAALGIDDSITALTPTALISAILRAPVDLLWNGGIGTYAKASTETHADAGDKANDSLRINGNELRVKVVGEGGNLGLTQRGRIEFARTGGRINTDALDNSAGVDCSDHEVNIKVALSSHPDSSSMSAEERQNLLITMTGSVSDSVLANNISQNELLNISRGQASGWVEIHSRLIDELEQRYSLVREQATLPTTAGMTALAREGLGLTTPQLATLAAQVKLTLKEQLVVSAVPDNGAFEHRLTTYFPRELTERYPAVVRAHPLRREIISTSAVNDMVDSAGITYAFRLHEETGITGPEAVKVYESVSQIFGLAVIFESIRSCKYLSDTASSALRIQTRRLLDRASRWLVANRPQPTATEAEIARYAERVHQHSPKVRTWLRGEEVDALGRRISLLTEQGASSEIASRVAELLHVYCLLDIIDIADITDRPVDEVAQLYYALSARLRINSHLTSVTRLGRSDRWDALARLALREDLYSSLRAITLDALTDTDPADTVDGAIDQWEHLNYARIGRAELLLSRVAQETGTAPQLASLSVAARRIRSIVRAPEPRI